MQVGRLTIAHVHARRLKATIPMVYNINGIRNISKEREIMEQESGPRRRRILVPSEESPLPPIPRVIPPSSFFLKKYVNKKQEWLSHNPQPPGVAPHPVRGQLDTYQPNIKSTWEEDRLESLSEHPAEFYQILDSVLRRSAPEMGLKVFPDGFFRLSAVLQCHKVFRSFEASNFIDLCNKDTMRRFELAQFPEFVDGQSREVLWIRARGESLLNGVDNKNQRVFTMSRLKTLFYIGHETESDKIEKYGINQGKTRGIRLYRSVESSSWNDSNVPIVNQVCLCVVVDAERAFQLGVTFFMNPRNFVLASGNSDGVIPREACLSGNLLRVKSIPLMNRRPTPDTSKRPRLGRGREGLPVTTTPHTSKR